MCFGPSVFGISKLRDFAHPSVFGGAKSIVQVCSVFESNPMVAAGSDTTPESICLIKVNLKQSIRNPSHFMIFTL